MKRPIEKELIYVLSLWPDDIELSGAVVDPPNRGNFPRLVETWNRIEKLIGEDETKLQLCWLVFREFHHQAMLSHSIDKTIVEKMSLDTQYILSSFK